MSFSVRKINDNDKITFDTSDNYLHNADHN